MIHSEQHPLAGTTVVVKVTRPYTGASEQKALYEFVVEDWADRLWGCSWGVMQGNPTALIYALRTGILDTNVRSLDDEVVYGKIHNRAVLVHQSEIPVQGAAQ